MNQQPSSALTNSPVQSVPELASLLADQRAHWQRGERVPCETYLLRCPTLADDVEATLDLIGNELLIRLELGERPLLAEYTHRFPQWAAELKVQFEVELAVEAESEKTELRHGPPSPHQTGDPTPMPTMIPANVSIADAPRRTPLPQVPDYDILREIAWGGQSVVYEARQIKLNRQVALKMLLDGAAADPEELARFRREAEAVAQLKHPHIVQIYDIGEAYLALEFVPGGTLAKRLAGRPQPAREAAQLMEVLARTMHWAHESAIVHRDLKPGNVLLTEDGTPKIADFGLAKRLNGDTHLTQTGHIMGTPAYMAPEQAAGKNHQVGPPADVYALGAMLYEMLVGHPPFVGQDAFDVITQVLTTDPVPPRRLCPHVPRDLETICLKCLAKEPPRRYVSAEALADDLQRYLAGHPIQARPVGTLGRLALWGRRKPALVATVVGALLAVALMAGAAVLQDREQQRQRRASHAGALVERLLDADIAQAPAIIDEIEPARDLADLLLRAAHEKAAAMSREKLRTSLALLPVDRTQADYLLGRLLEAEPHEVSILCAALAPHRTELLHRLWQAASLPGHHADQRLRAGCALALFDTADRRWSACADPIVEDLVAANPAHFGVWVKGLRPVRAQLLHPLARIFRDGRHREIERSLATSLVIEYAADQPDLLAGLLLDADDKQFNLLFKALSSHSERARSLFIDAIGENVLPETTEEKKERSAKRRAAAAAALLRMDEAARVWPLLRHRPDPRLRSYLIHRIGPLGANPALVVERLRLEADVTVRRALLLSLADFAPDAWNVDDKNHLLAHLRETFRVDADPGVHAAAEWLLRQFHDEPWLEKTTQAWVNDKGFRQQRVDQIKLAIADEKTRALPQWYLNGQELTMVVIPGPVEFLMGSPVTEAGRFADEPQHLQRINRTFAIAAKPVTVKQYLKFRPGFDYNSERAPADTCPVNAVNLYEAAAYCNWLSEQEGIPKTDWCYVLNPIQQTASLRKKYLELQGYRLPTGPEWEYACRAGAVTSRFYGETEELLDRYAWSIHNSKEPSWPVGTKKPNDLGLFDMLGNVWCWCQERYKNGPVREGPIDDDEEDLAIPPTRAFVSRGGSFRSFARHVRCARRNSYEPTTAISHMGFRPARTFR